MTKAAAGKSRTHLVHLQRQGNASRCNQRLEQLVALGKRQEQLTVSGRAAASACGFAQRGESFGRALRGRKRLQQRRLAQPGRRGCARRLLVGRGSVCGRACVAVGRLLAALPRAGRAPREPQHMLWRRSATAGASGAPRQRAQPLGVRLNTSRHVQRRALQAPQPCAGAPRRSSAARRADRPERGSAAAQGWHAASPLRAAAHSSAKPARSARRHQAAYGVGSGTSLC